MDQASARSRPEHVGRYRVVKELGRGMMGVVYLAEDPALERLIALKTIDLAFTVPEAERASFEQRFLAEARVAARLSHPGIVIVHDVGRDEAQGTLYIALEYLQGRTLSEVAAAGGVEWREALRVVARVARALHHAHAQGIVHRDVKPANIMVLPGGETKIMDFGIAKVPHLELTSAGQFFGTPLYMSPEQAGGQPVDGRADLFSLGAVAYFLLTGQQAFKADNVVHVLSRVLHEEPVPAFRLVPGLPEEVDLLLARAMAKDPARRYASGEAMAGDIDLLLAGRSIAEREELPTLELADLLEPAVGPTGTLVSPPRPRAAPAPSGGPPALAEPIPHAAPWAQEGTGPGSPALRRVAWAGLPLAALVVLGGVALRGKPSAPSAPAARVQPARTVATPAPEPPRARPVVEEVAPASAPARLAVDFEHHLRSGNLKVWVDDELALEEKLDSRVARKILSVRLRKGAVDEVLEVEPGRREVRVRVQWDDNVRSRRIAGTFRAGQTNTLQVRVSRIFNELSLKWR